MSLFWLLTLSSLIQRKDVLQIYFFSPGLFEKISPLYFFTLLMIYLDVSNYIENHSLATWKYATHLCLSQHCIVYPFFPSFTNNFGNLVLFFCYSCLNFIFITFYLFIYMCAHAHASQNTHGNQKQCEGIAFPPYIWTPDIRVMSSGLGIYLCPLRTLLKNKNKSKNYIRSTALQKN